MGNRPEAASGRVVQEPQAIGEAGGERRKVGYMTRTVIAAALTGAILGFLSTTPARAASLTFDFSWSSGSASFSGVGANTSATGSAVGTFTLAGPGIVAGASFDETDLTALDITVTTTNFGAVNYGLPSAVYINGQIDGSGNFATFSMVYLAKSGFEAFGCAYSNCSFSPQVLHGYDANSDFIDAWVYGSQQQAQASFVATASAVPVPPVALLFPTCLLASLGWIRRRGGSPGRRPKHSLS